MAKFRSVVLDVDSTLSAIEGIDWLGAQRGDAIRAQVADATARAMRGEISVAAVFGSRLAMVSPTREEIERLSEEYVKRAEPGAKEFIAEMKNVGVGVTLVSAGLREAVMPLAQHLGVADAALNAVHVHFGEDGSYAGYDEMSPVTRNGGKAVLLRSLTLAHPILGVGDGITDLEMKTSTPPAVDELAAYTGVVERQEVVRYADYVVRNFRELLELVLGHR